MRRLPCVHESVADTLSETHKFYTALYAQAPDEPSLALQNLDELGHELDFEETRELKLLSHLIDHLPANKAIGVDGWRNAELKKLSLFAKRWLLRLFVLCLESGNVPEIWVYSRLVCIPKPRNCGTSKIDDLRPLSIASCVYRLFAKWMLQHMTAEQDRVHPSSVGGIRRRSATQAWLPVAIRLENALANPTVLSETCFGFCIDTAKSFDNISFPVAVQALVSIRVPAKYIRCWLQYLGRLQRIVTLSGCAHTESVSCARGVPQGDPMSMLCAAACLAGWIESLNPYTTVTPKVYVDDRILLSNQSHEELCDAFLQTQAWDNARGFSTRAKTVAFNSKRKGDFQPVWEDGEPVKFAEQCDYLGVPLPLPGISRDKWFANKYCKAIDALRLIIRSKIAYCTASYIVARIVMPALAAASMVIRPTKQQSDNVRSLVVKAVFGKPLANTNACFLFLERMHALDPRWVFLYSSLCAWRRAFNCIPGLAAQVAYALGLPSLSRKKAAGPIALLCDDLQRLGLQLLPDGCTVTDEVGRFVFKFDTIPKGELQHLIRDKKRTCVIREFAKQSAKWKGIERVNIKATASIARQQYDIHTGQGPSVHERHTLTSVCRTITNAHPTPYRLHIMHLAETPHCRLCDHDCGDASHLMWHCPFFSAIRQQWPQFMHERSAWPPCALHFLVCTTDMPTRLQTLWPRVQMFASQVISAWMQIARLEDFSAYISDATLEPSLEATVLLPEQETLSLIPPRHSCCDSLRPLHFDWKPPETKGLLGHWGSSMRDWCFIFHFWTQWRHAEQGSDTRNWSWTEVTALFLSQGGISADFCAGCATWAQLTWKLRALSVKLLNDCLCEPDFSGPIQDPDITARWHISLPQERMLQASFTCEVTQGSVHILDLLDTIMARIGVDRPRATRKWVVEMSEVWPKLPSFCQNYLCDNPDKLLPKRTRLHFKSRVPLWQQTLSSRSSAAGLQAEVRAVGLEAVPLNTLLSQTQDSLRSMLEPQARVRVQGAIKRWSQVLDSIKSALKSDASMQQHVLRPDWSPGKMRCARCTASYDLSVSPVSWRRACPGNINACNPVQLRGFQNDAADILGKLRSLVFLVDFGSLHPPSALYAIADLQRAARILSPDNIFEKLDPCLKHPKNRRQLPVRWRRLIDAWNSADMHWFVPDSLMCNTGFCVKCFLRFPNFSESFRRPCSGHLLDSGDNYIGVADNLKDLRDAVCHLVADA